MISQGVTAPDREAFEEWFNAFNIKEMPEYQTIRDFSFAAWQAATAAKEAEIAALKAEWEALLKDAERYRWLAANARSTSEHWGGRWSLVIDGPAPKRHDCEDALDEAIDAAIAKAEGVDT